MLKVNYTEEDWLDLYLLQRQFPNWSFELQEAYYLALNNFEKIQKDIQDAHRLACKSLLEGVRPSMRGAPMKRLSQDVMSNSIIKNSTETDLQRTITEILSHQKEIGNRSIEEKRKLFKYALDNVDVDRELSLTKYHLWLRYAYWTEEEAVEFALRSTEGVEFENLLKSVKNENVFRNIYGDILPMQFCEWVKDYSRKAIFKKDDLEQMAPDRLDTLKVIRRKKVYALLLALVDRHYKNPKSRASDLSRLCSTFGDTVTSDTIRDILSEAENELGKV